MGAMRVGGDAAVAVGIIAALILCPGARAQEEAVAPVGPDAGGIADVVVEGDRVTGTFEGVTPAMIVDEIAEAAGAEVVGGAEGADPVSIDLDDVPVDRALQRALAGQSFTIVYGADGTVRRIRLHGLAQDLPASSSVVNKKPASAGGSIAPHELFNVEVKIPDVGPLADHLGTETATLGTLYQIAIDEDEAALRIAAVDAGMAAIEADGNLQGSIDTALDSTDDATLAGLVRTSAGTRANELVSRILSRTRRPQVRQRAVTLLRQLRKPVE